MPDFIISPRASYPFADSLRHVSCVVPFRHIEIALDGKLYACCPAWLPVPCGDLSVDDIEQVINNPRLQAVHESMQHGDFDYCNDQCPALSNYMLTGPDNKNNTHIVSRDNLDEVLMSHEYMIYLCYDDSCNLQCPSCRHGLILHRQDDGLGSKFSKIQVIHSKVKLLVAKLLDQGHRVNINITGSGDSFASPTYWQYLQELSNQPRSDNLTIELQTNGVMMTAGRWDLINELLPSIRFVSISMDAATADTYSMVRKGGNFQKLLENLESFDNMVLQGKFPNLRGWQTNFILQQANFRELAEYVSLVSRFQSIQWIYASLVAQWGHISDENFRKMAVWQQSHPEHQALLEVLANPILKDPRIMLGNIQSLIN